MADHSVSEYVEVKLEGGDDRIAYVLQDIHHDDFVVYRSANAWWMNSRKVQNLIDAFKQGHLVETACYFAGITRGQWEYFNKVHPEFSGLREQIECHPMFIRAINSVAGQLELDPKLSLSYLKSTHPKFKREKEKPVEPPLMQQTVQIAVSQNVDTAKIEADIARAADALLGDFRGTEGGGTQLDRQGLEAEGARAGA